MWNIRIKGIQGGERERSKNTKLIMADNFPQLITDTKLSPEKLGSIQKLH